MDEEIRHGHIRYGRDNTKSIADFKSMSENVMHSNMAVTDAVYSQMVDDDFRDHKSSLGRVKNSEVKKTLTSFSLNSWLGGKAKKDNEKRNDTGII